MLVDTPTEYVTRDGDVVSTIWRCEHCGAPGIPRRTRQRFCSSTCRETAKSRTPTTRARNARWRESNAARLTALRALRRRGQLTPETRAAADALARRGPLPLPEVLAAVGIDTRPVVTNARGRRFRVGLPPAVAALDPWALPSPSTEGWVQFAGLSLTLDPPHVVDYTREHARRLSMLHGALTSVHGAPHDATQARWTLLPHDDHGRSGWAVMWRDPADAARLAGTSHRRPLGACQEVTLRFGAMVTRPRPPAPLAPGRYRVRVDAISPVSTSRHGQTPAVAARPSRDKLAHSLLQTAARVGVDPGRVEVSHVEYGTRAAVVRLGGHKQGGARPGQVNAWTGYLVIECNAPAAWLLQAAERGIGWGGCLAYGLGRVRVEVTRC